MYWANSKKRRHAFTFIEIMIVVLIIGLLAGAVTLSTRHFLDRAKENRARTDLSTFKNALAAFYADNGRYPSNDEGLNILAPKYIERVSKDPWARFYQYNSPGRNGPYEVLSLGPDGKEGEGNISSDDLEINPSADNSRSPS